MKELLGHLERWQAADKRAAIARVVDVAGSSPRDPGAAMAVNEDGEIVGSVSGGCVEGAVVEAAQEALATDEAALITFGYSDDDAFAVGLTCGGTIQLFIEPFGYDDEVHKRLEAALRNGDAAVLSDPVHHRAEHGSQAVSGGGQRYGRRPRRRWPGRGREARCHGRARRGHHPCPPLRRAR